MAVRISSEVIRNYNLAKIKLYYTVYSEDLPTVEDTKTQCF